MNNVSIDDADTFLLERLKGDEYFDGDEIQVRLQSAILTLPEKQRLVFNMKYNEEMKYEECWCLYLNTGNRIVERQRVSQGGVQATVVDHRLVIKRALELLATQIILVHNHPSGAALPSEQDKILTKKIAEAAALFDIRLLDHLIIARGGEYSFRQSGLLQ